MQNQFDTCSYDELTRCIKHRIKDIRQFRRFLTDPVSLTYQAVRTTVLLKILIQRSEIRRLLKMRRVLKKSPLENWDSSILKI